MKKALDIQEGVTLAPYTIYKLGGPARYFARVDSAKVLDEALLFAQEKGVPFFIMGAGSNTLVSDAGYSGLVIHMEGGDVRFEGEHMIADAGVMMARAAGEAAREGCAGFEWGIGIPGTIGGSVRGNAGCFGGEMKDVVVRVHVVMVGEDGVLSKRELSNEECAFAYRHSLFKEHPEMVITQAVLALSPGNKEDIQDKVRAITQERVQKQSIGAQCAGCIFKNISWQRKDIDKEKLLRDFPELAQFVQRDTIPTSFLIDHADLKGKRIGRVSVSLQHANFFVNEGGATAEHVAMLIGAVKDALLRKYGVIPEEEIQYVGF